MQITPIPCLSDNYAYLVVCDETGDAALVDASEAGPVIAAIEAAKAKRPALTLRAIWATHHHPDHVGGNDEVAAHFGVPEILGYASDRGRIPGQTRFLADGETFALGRLKVAARHIPGHTLGAVLYTVTPPAPSGGAPAVFTGDTMFLAGCGRLFEGTPAQMHASLGRIAESGGDAARVYCGHEYTASNLRFAAHVEPSNAAVRRAAERAAALRADGKPTVPGTIAEERATNPFLRTDSPEIRKTLGIPADADAVTALAAIRKAKDGFK